MRWPQPHSWALRRTPRREGAGVTAGAAAGAGATAEVVTTGVADVSLDLTGAGAGSLWDLVHFFRAVKDAGFRTN